MMVAGGSLSVDEEGNLKDQTLELALRVNSALQTQDADDLVDAVSRFMKFHKMTANPEVVAQIPIRMPVHRNLELES